VAVGRADREGFGAPGVLVTGSVVAVGEARTLLVTNHPPVSEPHADRDDDWDVDDEDDA